MTECLDQIDQVTQSNAASTEESAAAAEQLSGQAEHLRAIVRQWKLHGGAGAGEHGLGRLKAGMLEPAGHD